MGGRFYISRRETQRHVNSFTFYLAYEGPLPAQTQTKEVKVDITLTEFLVFPLQPRPILKSYSEYSDFPEHDRLPTYSLEEVATEKVVALLDPARNEPRDLFDIWYLTTHEGIALDALIPAIVEKLAFRKEELHNFKNRLATKESRYGKTWEQRLSIQMGNLPRFETVFRSVQRAFRQADL
jgi:predicted nucleotidyltransferase component of viral defense system